MKLRTAAGKRILQLQVRWAIIAAPVILFAPLWLGGKALFWGTPALQFVPWRWIAGEMLSRMELPLWNPLSGMGAPLLANYQSAFLYPPNWLLFLLQAAGSGSGNSPSLASYNLGLAVAAWGQTLLVAAHLIWAGWGTARLAQRLGLNTLAQNVAGISFGMSGYLVARSGFLSINAAAAWLPWSILAAEALARPTRSEKRMRTVLSSSLVFAMLLLAGHAQTAWYVLLLAGVWAIVRSAGVENSTKAAPLPSSSALRYRFTVVLQAGMLLGVSILLGSLLSAAQLLPTGEYLLQSQRAAQVDYQQVMTYSFWPWHFITLLAPGFFGSPVSGDYWGYANYWEDAIYIGLLPFLLALAAAATAFQRVPGERGQLRTMVRLLVGIAAFSFLLALGDNTPVFPWLYRYIPTFDMFQAPARFGLWAVFALALLAGIGVHQWRRPTGAGLYWLRLGTMGAFAVTAGSGLGWVVLGDVSPTFIRAAAVAGLWGIAAGLVGLNAPVPEETHKIGGGEPFLRRMLRKIFPSLVMPGYPEKTPTRNTPRAPSWCSRLRSGMQPRLAQHWPALVLCVVAADLIVASWGLNPGVELDFYANAPDLSQRLGTLAADQRVYLPGDAERILKFDVFLRFDTYTPGIDWRWMRADLLPNLNLLEGIASVNNFDPLVPGRYDRWMQALEALEPEQKKMMLNLMGVAVVENIVDSSTGLVQFDPLPGAVRWRWLPCAQIVSGEERAWEQTMEAGSALLDEVVIVEGFAGTPAQECGGSSTAPAAIEKVAESAKFLELQVSSTQDGWLLVADTWYPGWSAKLDNREAPLLRGNYLFRAVRVPAGAHRIRFEYNPGSFQMGAGASLAAWLIYFLLLFGVNITSRFSVRGRN